jgi:C-terminal processing protease CtpA/Prc
MFWARLILLFLLAVPLTSGAQERIVGNIEAYAKLYGYIRYFYPGDIAAGIDWDCFSMKALPMVMKPENNRDLMEILDSLFTPIAPEIVFTAKCQDSSGIIARNNKCKPCRKNQVYWIHQGYSDDNSSQWFYSFRTNRQVIQKKEYVSLFKQSVSLNSMDNGKISVELIGRTGTFQKGDFQLQLMQYDSAGKYIYYYDNIIGNSKAGNNLKKFTCMIQQKAVRVELNINASGPGLFKIDDLNYSFSTREGDTVHVAEVNNAWTTIRNVDFYDTLRRSAQIQFLEKYCPVEENLVIDLTDSIRVEFPVCARNTLPVNSFPDYCAGFSPGDYSPENKYARLTSVIELWNIFKNFYPFGSPLTDNGFRKALRKCINEPDEQEFSGVLKEMLSPVKDSHINIFGPEDNFFPSFFTDICNDTVFVTQVLDSSLPLQKGDLIKSINDIPVSRIIDSLAGLNSAANPASAKIFAIAEVMKGRQGTKMKLEITRKGSCFVYEVLRDFNKWDLSVTDVASKFPAIQWMEDSIIYINIGVVTESLLNRETENIAKSKGIIVDLRQYPYDSSVALLLEHIVSVKTEIPYYYFVPVNLMPDKGNNFSDPEKNYRKFLPRFPSFSQPFIVLIDKQTTSMGETYAYYFKNSGRAKLIGERTQGTTGSMNDVLLTSTGFRVSYTGAYFSFEDKRPFALTSIEPDIVVSPSCRDKLKDEDYLIQYALKYLIRQRIIEKNSIIH